MFLKELQNPCLEGAVTDGEHMISALNIKCSAVRKKSCEPFPGTGNVVLGAHADQHRCQNARHLRIRYKFARGRDASSKSLSVASRLIGEGAEHLSAWVGDGLWIRCDQCFGNRVPIAD